MLVEGINYTIKWRDFTRGKSIFVLCLDPEKAKAAVLREARRLRVKVMMKVEIRDGVQGLRIWRM